MLILKSVLVKRILKMLLKLSDIFCLTTDFKDSFIVLVKWSLQHGMYCIHSEVSNLEKQCI